LRGKREGRQGKGGKKRCQSLSIALRNTKLSGSFWVLWRRPKKEGGRERKYNEIIYNTQRKGRGKKNKFLKYYLASFVTIEAVPLVISYKRGKEKTELFAGPFSLSQFFSCHRPCWPP